MSPENTVWLLMFLTGFPFCYVLGMCIGASTFGNIYIRLTLAFSSGWLLFDGWKVFWTNIIVG